MKKIILLLVFLISTLIGYSAGPPPICTSTGNDLCVNAISLTINAVCSDGCTEGSTTSIGENFGCASGNKSIWYKFVATATSHQVNVWQDASNGCFNGSVVWSGGCLPSIVISCHDAAFGPLNQAHLLTGLIIGNTYLIQVLYTSGGPCGSNADVCVEVITYLPCDCGIECYAACTFISDPIVSDVTCCCPSMTYNPPMHERIRKECYTFTASRDSAKFSAIVSSDCGGGQFTSLNWTVYNSSCVLIDGPTSIFSDNVSNVLSAGGIYTVCFNMTFAECNISRIWTYVVVWGIVLPIRLLYFKGKLIEDNNVYLNWVTLSETNNDYFTLERSIDGFVFNKIINIDGAGNSSEYLYYDYIDNDPYEGVSYYRLKQTDYDGKYEYSNIVSITIDIDKIEYVYYDICGRIMLKKWEELPVGIYISFDGRNYQKLLKF